MTIQTAKNQWSLKVIDKLCLEAVMIRMLLKKFSYKARPLYCKKCCVRVRCTSSLSFFPIRHYVHCICTFCNLNKIKHKKKKQAILTYGTNDDQCLGKDRLQWQV